MGDIGDAPAPVVALLGLAQLGQVDAVEDDRAGGDPAAGPGIAHGGEADGRFAGAGFADQPQHLAAPHREVDALDDLLPDVVGLPLDPEAPDLQQQVALHAARRPRAASVRPAF